jgi:hypothetical protein
MKRESFEGISFECDLDVEKERQIEIAIISKESLDLTYMTPSRERYHLEASSTDGTVYVGRWTYSRSYENAPAELGETTLRLYRANDQSALLCGTFHDYEHGDGRWIIELTPTTESSG